MNTYLSIFSFSAAQSICSNKAILSQTLKEASHHPIYSLIQTDSPQKPCG